MSEEELLGNEPHGDDELEESGSDYSYIKKADRRVFIDKNQHSIFELHRHFTRGDIVLKPYYQRQDVWTYKKKSRLIESVLLTIPIPVIYMAEREDGKKEVVDGQQRLSSFFDFLENKYSLISLEIMAELNKKFFRDFEKKYPDLQRKFEDCQLSIFVIKKESHKDIRFDVFQRVNEGATKLNAQELRNVLYRGYRIELLKEMAKDENFKKMIQNKLAISRLKDHEAVLRFLAFYIHGYQKYSGNLNSFLNSTLEKLPQDEKDVEQLKRIFSSAMKIIFKVLGKDAFIKGDSSKKKINLSLFDVLCWSFTQFDSDEILKKKEQIIEKFQALIEEKGKFYYSITANTLTKNSVKTRFGEWSQVMKDCVRGGK
jgi:hypothetical protein